MIANKAAATNQSQTLSLYYYDGCPFCNMTLKALEQIDLDVDLRHIRRQPQYRTELIKQGGKPQVPCLRIEGDDGETNWLYESRDIISYLRSNA
jgi:glutaredoxin